MEESGKKKKGFLGKVFSVLSGKPDGDAKSSPDSRGKFAPRQKEPVDLTFVKNFTASGGKFLYCEDEKDTYEFLRNISKESGTSLIFCKDPNLQSILSQAGLEVTDKNLGEADAFCAGCEFLISFNGGIMISENQTGSKKLSELPETFITIARASQIVENLRSGLTGIRKRYHGAIPSQITTIKGPVDETDLDQNAGPKTCTKDIYLLLLEDQL